MYDHAEYARTRLVGTIVLHRRTPVYIETIKRDMTATVYNPLQKNAKAYQVPLCGLNLLDFELGFINKPRGAVYLSRKPLRHDWRQGLRTNNVHSSNGRTTMDDIAGALLHRYPSFQQVAKRVLVDRLVPSCAWCQEFAMNSQNKIIWRYDVVGQYSHGDSAITLDARFKFLKYSLEEVTRDSCKVF